MNENKPPVVAIETLGCKLNQAESEALARTFLEKGFQLGRPEDGCDVYLLNTCTVTHVADRKARQLLRQARRQNPGAVVVATGCLAERAPDQIATIKKADLIAGNPEKENLPSKIAALLKMETHPPTTSPKMPGWGRTRAMVKIQEGCGQSCTYCIVPSVRGRGRSLSPRLIPEQIRSLVAGGYREIVLTGTDIGAYKADGANLAALVKSILGDTPLERLRLSSLQAQEISPELLSLWQDPRLCRHVHLPLQSGSDTVLRLMRRRYTADDFRKAVSILREVAPGMAITTDVIVGFPGESDLDFQQTEMLCKDVGFARIHAFPYSPRPGTPAAAMTPRVSPIVQRQRLARLLEIARTSSENFRRRFHGSVLPVLWERPVKGESGLWSGLTDNYIRVFTSDQAELHNRILPVRLVKIEGGRVWGELAD